MFNLLRLVVLALVLAAPLSAFADPPASDKAKEEEKKKDPPKPSVTEHSVTIGGKVVRYRVTAGMLPLMDDKLKVKANVFNVAYERLADGDEKDKDGKLVTLASKEAGGGSGRSRLRSTGGRGRRACGCTLGRLGRGRWRWVRRVSGCRGLRWRTTPTRGSTSPIWCSSIR